MDKRNKILVSIKERGGENYTLGVKGETLLKILVI